jgi:hypothetical protein
MPMLHNCGFANCSTLTSPTAGSTRCSSVETLEAERTQAAARSRRVAAELVLLDDADVAQQPAAESV